MKYSELIFYLIVILLLYYVYDLYCKSHATIENFEDKYEQTEKYEDIYDKEFVDFYNIIYNESKTHNEVTKIISNEISHKNDPQILVIGSNCGHLLKSLKTKYKHVTGLDKSEWMLKKCHSIHPYIKTIKADISKDNLFETSTYDVIIFESSTLNQNNEKNIKKILKNIHSYLKENGILICPIYEEKTLNPRPRYYTTNYIDTKKNIHGFTYLNDFNHDCYYIKRNEKDSNGHFNFDYFDKIVLKSKKHRIKKTPLYIPEKEDYYEIIISRGFDIKKIYDLDELSGLIVYELAFFKKKNVKININDLEKK